MSSINLGHLIEGVVEQDPLTDRYVIRTFGPDGKVVIFDPQEALKSLHGKEVRLTLASFENLARLASLIEGEGVFGVMPEDIPGAPFDVKRSK